MREMRERRFFLPTALVAGLAPLLLWVMASPGSGLRLTAEVAALVLMFAFPTAVGISLGASVLGRDLAERRLGFYFARPLRGSSIWGGKMLAAMLLTLLTTALLFVLSYPTLASNRFVVAESTRLAAAL